MERKMEKKKETEGVVDKTGLFERDIERKGETLVLKRREREKVRRREREKESVVAFQLPICI